MRKTLKIGVISIITVMAILMSVCVHASTTTEILGGKVTITDSIGNGSGDATQYKITVTSSRTSSKTNTITIANESGKDGMLAFDYDASGQSGFTLASESVAASGSYSNPISSGASVSITLTAKNGFLSTNTATLTLTNIVFEEVADTSDVVYKFDSSLGSVTAGGTAISNGDTVTVDAVGTEMVATAKSGVTFLGWVNMNGQIVSTSNTYTQKAYGADTVTAIFSNNTVPYYEVDSKYIFSDLDDATAAGSNLVLLCNATLPAGKYTIPAGKTLHIPMDATKTLYTTTPPSAQMTTYKAPTLYRKLTLESDAEFIVDGAISVAGKLSASQGSHCSLIGTYGQIDMKSGSTITINNGAKLYAWGYITGLGSITAKSGATVYEPFQVRDWRGGTAVSSDMLNNKQKVFPMSQYYVQNVEVALTLESGAVENGFMCMFVTGTNLLGGDGIQKCEFTFIGKNEGMFRIDSGSITKDYNENTDRLVIDVDGTLSMSPLTISMKITAGLPSTINSENYTLPVNGGITLHVNGGSTINISQEMALLPGGEIYVHEGAICNFAADSKAYIYDSAEWGAYCGHTNKIMLPACHSVGRKYTRTADDLVDAFIYVEGEVNASSAEVYTTASGANITGAEGGKVSLAHGAETVTYQVTQSGSEITTWNEIPVTVAQLKNAGVDGQEGIYVKPETLGDCGKQFTYTNGVWEPTHTNIVTVSGTAATCTATGLTDGIKCETCGTVIQEQTIIPITDHTWDAGVITTPATSTTPGVKTYTCTGCSTTKTEEIPVVSDPCAGGHAWDAGVVTTPATHLAEGVKTYTCTTCGTTKTEAVEKTTDHSYTSSVTKEATCEETGSKTYTCECGDSYTETIAATGHAYDAGVITTPATHIAEGVKTFTCGTCGKTKEEAVAKLTGHTHVESITKAPTCEETGSKTYTCECGDSYTEEIAATGHAYDAGVITTPATHIAEGVKTFTCGNCGETYTETIEKTAAHEYGEWAKVDGRNHARECICGLVETEAHEFEGFACTDCGADKIITSTVYSIADGQIKINPELVCEVPEGTQIIIAVYTANGQLINATISAADELSEISFASAGVAKIRISAWSGFSLLKPISIPERLKLN